MQKAEYRTLIKQHSTFVNISKLMDYLDISRGNFTGFMSGEDKRLSLDKCEIILNALKKMQPDEGTN